MNYPEFMTAIEQTYGSYSAPILKTMTAKYIMEQYKECDLDNIFGTIIIKVNPKFKTPPSPADFEEFFPRVN